MPRPLTRIGMAKGVLGGSRFWLVVWVVAVGGRALRKLVHKEPEVAYREELPAGQSLVITHLPHHVR